MANSKGTVIQVMGPVLDIRFADNSLPQLLSAIEIPHGEGKIVADEKTENIEGALRGNQRLSIRIDGPQAAVQQALKRINGVVYAEFAQKHDDGTTTFIVESKNQFDVRRPIFFMLAENSWPILSLEYTGASLENIFISVVDEAEAKENAPAETKKKA